MSAFLLAISWEGSLGTAPLASKSIHPPYATDVHRQINASSDRNIFPFGVQQCRGNRIRPSNAINSTRSRAAQDPLSHAIIISGRLEKVVF
eukprot:scaffold1829_cov194-Ochromonas_danica.AAC.32